MVNNEYIAEEELVWEYREWRWWYISYVIELIKENKFKDILELGAYTNPIVKWCDIMDRYDYSGNTKYVHDATTIPRPVDKVYDCFIGLQCREHLWDKQSEAFKEVCRISRNAILSFPYKRNCPGDCHHQIDETVIERRTNWVKPFIVERVGSRIIYFFKDIWWD